LFGDSAEPLASSSGAFRRNQSHIAGQRFAIGDLNAEMVSRDLGKTVQQLKQEAGKGLFMRGLKLPLTLAWLTSVGSRLGYPSAALIFSFRA
jgi:hypothetical protein